jgi:hypothetical protein
MTLLVFFFKIKQPFENQLEFIFFFWFCLLLCVSTLFHFTIDTFFLFFSMACPTDIIAVNVEKNEHGFLILRDDLLEGGTKSVIIPKMIDNDAATEVQEYVYASPVYGMYQVALSAYCKNAGKRAIIFCAKRAKMYINTQRCVEMGAVVHEIPFGRLTVIEKRARDYVAENPQQRKKIAFGGGAPEAIRAISQRMRHVTANALNGVEPEEIWCAVGSGTLVTGILSGTSYSKVFGVVVGKKCNLVHPRLTLYTYPQPFSHECKTQCDFQSNSNYDRKAYEFMLQKSTAVSRDKVLFWNVAR